MNKQPLKRTHILSGDFRTVTAAISVLYCVESDIKPPIDKMTSAEHACDGRSFCEQPVILCVTIVHRLEVRVRRELRPVFRGRHCRNTAEQFYAEIVEALRIDFRYNIVHLRCRLLLNGCRSRMHCPQNATKCAEYGQARANA